MTRKSSLIKDSADNSPAKNKSKKNVTASSTMKKILKNSTNTPMLLNGSGKNVEFDINLIEEPEVEVTPRETPKKNMKIRSTKQKMLV